MSETSPKGRQYIMLAEGNPLTGYLDPASPPVPTIGPGLTNKSPIVTREIGRIVPGVTKITAATADRVFALVLAEEVDPVVTRGMPGARQHEHDAGASGGYNLGAERHMGWTWAQLWRAGRKSDAWDWLADHYNTAGGRKLPGLVRRRKEEADIGRMAHYAGIDDGRVPAGLPRDAQAVPPAAQDPVVREAQEILTAKGFDPGAIDGWMGEQTKAAVLAYQEAHPHLVNDGILGAATIAQLRRDAQAAREVAVNTATRGGGGGLVAGVASFFAGLPWGWIAAAVVLGTLIYFGWRYRDVIVRRFNSWRGRKVVV